MKRAHILATVGVLTAGVAPARADDERQVEPIEVRSPHADALRQHRHLPRPARTYPAASPRRARAVEGIVYGYLPYWISDLSSMRFEDLSHLADFSVEVNTDGSMGATHGWPDTALVEAAHAAGVKVEIAFTLFSGSGLSTLLSSGDNRTRCVTGMIDQLEAGGADGISVDFEGVPSSAREDFVLFLQELRAGLDERGHTGAGISVAAPSVDWGDAWDEVAILEVVDLYFVMAYTYFWSGSSFAGPPGLFRTSADWASTQTRSTLRSVATINDQVGEDLRHKIVFGVPYYGREWTTASSSWPTDIVAHTGAVTYTAARSRLAAGATRTWDDGICQPAIIEPNGNDWNQVWYDDEQSLACKYQLFREQEIGGMGIWALGYAGSHSELWDLLEQYYTSIPDLGEGSRDQPYAIEALPYTTSGDTSAEGYRYFNYYACSPDTAEYGRELVYRFDTCQSGTLTASVEPAAGVDVDVHLLDGILESACLARDDVELQHEVTPGRYFLVVDTFVNSSGVEQEGAFSLSVDLAPEAGSTGCGGDTVCDAGECVCADGSDQCGEVCTDLASDANHCGECDQTCAAGVACVDGACEEPPPEEAGCSCHTGHRRPPPAELLILFMAALLLRSRGKMY